MVAPLRQGNLPHGRVHLQKEVLGSVTACGKPYQGTRLVVVTRLDLVTCGRCRQTLDFKKSSRTSMQGLPTTWDTEIHPDWHVTDRVVDP